MKRSLSLVVVAACVAALGLLQVSTHAFGIRNLLPPSGDAAAIGVNETLIRGTVDITVGANFYPMGSKIPRAAAISSGVNEFFHGETMELVMTPTGKSGPMEIRPVTDLTKDILQGEILPQGRGGFISCVGPAEYAYGYNARVYEVRAAKDTEVRITFMGIKLPCSRTKEGYYRFVVPFMVVVPPVVPQAGNEKALNQLAAQANMGSRPTNPTDLLAGSQKQPPPPRQEGAVKPKVTVRISGMVAGSKYVPAWSKDGKIWNRFPSKRTGSLIEQAYSADQDVFVFDRDRGESLWFQIEYYVPLGSGRWQRQVICQMPMKGTDSDIEVQVNCTNTGGAR